MMKIIAILLIAILLLTAAVAVADEVNWSSFEKYASIVGGQFYELDGLGLKIFIPDDMSYVEDEECFAVFTSAEQDKAVAVNVGKAAVADLDELAAAITQIGARDIEHVVVNGMPCLSYLMDDSLGEAFLTDDGYYIIVVANPYSEAELDSGEGFSLDAAMILCSIQRVE